MATKKKVVEKTADKVALYDKLIASRPQIERKGDANPYTAVNGNMFTILVGSETLGIRLPEEERQIMNLLWYRGLTHAQAAEALGLATKTVQRRWASARLLLQDALDGKQTFSSFQSRTGP